MGVAQELNQHLQDGMVLLAIRDTNFCKIISGRLDPSLATSSLTEDLLRLSFDYFKVTGEAPGDHIQDELDRFLATQTDDRKEQFEKYLDRLAETHLPNHKYLIGRLDDFIRIRAREDAILKAADLLQEGRADEVDALLSTAMKAGLPEADDSVHYFKDFSGVLERDDCPDLLMPTGMRGLDKLIGGYGRGRLVVTLGGYKAGKSWWLLHTAMTAARHGLRALYISHENTKEETELRADMMRTGRGWGRAVGQKVKYLVQFDDYGVHRLKWRERHVDSIYESPKRVIAARKAYARLGGDLIIKKFPAGRCSPAQTDQYLDYLEEYEGWTPDVILIDYVDIMDLSSFSQDTRHQINGGYLWAKGLSDERNVLVCTVSQVQRAALKRRKVTEKHVAEEARKIAHCDLMLAIGRDETDTVNNLASMNVLVNRTGQQGGTVLFSLCYDIGQFCKASWPLTSAFDEEVGGWLNENGFEADANKKDG